MAKGPLFGRIAKLVIAPVDGTPGKDVSGLRIAFDVEKTSASQPNKANVKVWNLTAETRKMVAVKKQAIMLDAGYEDDLIYRLTVGVIQRVEHRKEPPDIVTEMEIRDGGLGLDDTEFRRAYPAGTSCMQVFRDIVEEMPDVTMGPVSAAGLSGVLPAKLALTGNARRSLDKLARALDFEWSVQDGSLQAIDRTKTTQPTTLAVVLSQTTGMVGSPALTERGVKVTSLLMPQIKPGGYVKVESEFAAGYYKAMTVHHSGDTHGQEWQTETDCKSLTGTKGAKKSKGKK